MNDEEMKQLKVLFLEDNKIFAKHTMEFLELYVGGVTHICSMKEALEKFHNIQFDIIICDLKVEDGNALSFIEQIRKEDKNIPIVVLSAHKDEEFLFKAIPLSLTSYELKPINFERFKEVLLLCKEKVFQNKKNIVYVKESIFFDKDRKVLIKNDQEVSLTKKEALFIELLINNKTKIVTKEQVEASIWQDTEMTESALKNFLMRVRKKAGKTFFTTIQSVGFRL